MKVTVDKSGRLVIPKEIRELSGLKKGAEFHIDYRNGQILMWPVCKAKLVRKGTLLTSRVPGAPKMTLEESNRLIRRLREGRL